jgi:ribosomal protein S18 acetylase RimI-like enzyme
MPLNNETGEIKNIAVAPSGQRKGYGKQLIDFVLAWYKDKYQTMLVGTSDSIEDAVLFYRRCGFVYDHRIKNFFIDNYKEPVIDGGVQCIDMVVLKYSYE